MNVLVIEDNLFDFCILDEMLKKSGDPAVRLVHCYSLSDGFQTLEQEPFDLILLDLNLPGNYGIDTFKAVYSRVPHIPIILISALDSAELAVQAVKAGAQDYLVKGKINTDLLVRTMRYALERKRLIEELRASEERYHVVSDLISDYAWSLAYSEDGQSKLEWVTGSLHKLAGFKVDSLPTLAEWKELVHPNDLVQLVAHIRQIGLDRPGVIEFRLKLPDGSYRWVRHHSLPVKDQSTGKLLRIYGAGKDITERKDMESKLREAEDRYRSIFDGVNDAILVESRNGRILDANLSACKLYGYSREQLLAKHVSEIVPEEYVQVLAADTAELKAKMPQHPIEVINVRSGGERFPVEISINAYPIGNETVSLVVVRDISQRRQAEEAYRALVDRSLQELYIVQDGRIAFANQAALRNTGYSMEELQEFSTEEILYGTKSGDNRAVYNPPPEQRKAWLPAPSRREFQRMRKDGTIGWASTLATQVQYHGRPATQIALIDVSERKQAEEAYRALVEQSLQELLIFQEGRIVFANPAAVKNSGYSLKELMAFTAEELLQAVIDPEDAPTFVQGQAELVSRERPSVLQEIRITGKDGQTRWVEALSISIEYQGNPAIQTVQFDVTERKQVENRLNYRHEIEALVTSVSTRFINLTSDRIDTGIQAALQSLARFTGADRAYIYILSSDWIRFDAAYEWCAQGIENRAETLIGEPFESYRWMLQKFKNREAVVISSLDQIPAHAVAERTLAEKSAIQSTLSIPLVLNNMLFGFWGFETMRAPKDWAEEDVSLLRIMGDVFVNALARKQTDQVLRRARQELDQVINSVSDALWTAEVDCETGQIEYRYISPVIERITGRSPEYFRQNSKPWIAIVPVEDREWVSESLSRTWKERTGLVVEEYRILLPDGQTRWIRDSRSASETGAGRVRLDAVLSDITERKQAEEAYRLLVEQSLQELLIYQAGRIVFANPAAVQNSGYSRDELLALSVKEVSELIHPSDREIVRQRSLARLAGQPVPEREEFRMFNKNGRMRWIESLSILIEYQGKPSIQAAQIDITERKLTEERLRHRIEIEEMVTNLSAGFINLSTEEVDSHIEDALREIGAFTGVDRCYLNLISPDGRRILRDYNWSVENCYPIREDFSGLDLDPFVWSLERQRRQEIVHVPRVADLPPEASFEKSFWQALQRRSVLNIPLILDENLFGTLGFANEREEKEWAEEDIRTPAVDGRRVRERAGAPQSGGGADRE